MEGHLLLPKDFTFVCPTEITGFAKLKDEFEDRDAVLMAGSTDNEHVKLAWRRSHADLDKLNHWMFADSTGSLVDQLGVRDSTEGVALRATFIVDPDNTIQHVTVNNLNVGRSPEETLASSTACRPTSCAPATAAPAQRVAALSPGPGAPAGPLSEALAPVKACIPDEAKDLRLNLGGVIERSPLAVDEAVGRASPRPSWPARWTSWRRSAASTSCPPSRRSAPAPRRP